MSTWKRMTTGLASLLVLAAAPAALADETVATASDVQVPVTAPAASDSASKDSADDAEAQILELQEEVKDLRSQLADRDANGPHYLNQNLQPWR
jgi:TolA-binding protein